MFNLNGLNFNVPSMVEQPDYTAPSEFNNELDIFADTTQDFNVNTLIPNLNTSDNNLLGFQSFDMTPTQKVDYGIATPQEQQAIANDPWAGVAQIGENLKAAAATPEGAAQLQQMRDVGYKSALDLYNKGEYQYNNSAKGLLDRTREQVEANKDNKPLYDLYSQQLSILENDEDFMAKANTTLEDVVNEAGGFENYYNKRFENDAMSLEDMTSGNFDYQNLDYFAQQPEQFKQLNDIIYNVKEQQRLAARKSSPLSNPLFNIAANALTGGAWSVVTGAFNTIDAAVNEEWADAVKAGAKTYASYNTVEANNLLDKADDLDAAGYADAADRYREEAAALKDTSAALSGVKDIVSGDVFSGMLTGAPLIGVDPVGGVMETVFGVSAEDDALNNYKFGGGFDVSAASEGLVKAGGSLLDTGGDLGTAAQKGLLTYAKEGGSTPFEVPDIGGGSLLPNLAFSTPQAIKDLGDYLYEAQKPVGQAIADVGEAAYEAQKPIGQAIADVGEAAYEAQKPVGQAIDDYIIDPIDEAIRQIEAPDVNVPDFNVDLNAPDFNVDLTAPDFNMELPTFESPEFSSVDINLPDLPSLKFNLSEGKKKELEELPRSAKIKVASILTDATFLQLTPLQQRDYLDELLRSMQA